MYRALSKVDDLKKYANALSMTLTGSGNEIISLAQDWFNENIDELELYVKEYFSGDAEITHEIQLLKKLINNDVRNLKGVHEVRTEAAKTIIINKLNDIENIIKERIIND